MSQSTSHQLPVSWVEKIFSRMHGIYGNQFAAKWDGISPDAVKQVWAEELGGFSDIPEAIAYALKNLDPKFPPSALEFRDLCRKAPRKDVLALPHKLTAEEIERQREMAQKVTEAAGKREGFDHLDWAKHPGSKLAFSEVLRMANRGDSLFKVIVEQLMAEGATDGHVAKKLWDGQSKQWVLA